MNSRKPKETRPSVPSTRASITSGNCREKMRTPSAHHDIISIHSSNEPSCPPHTAEMR